MRTQCNFSRDRPGELEKHIQFSIRGGTSQTNCFGNKKRTIKHDTRIIQKRPLRTHRKIFFTKTSSKGQELHFKIRATKNWKQVRSKTECYLSEPRKLSTSGPKTKPKITQHQDNIPCRFGCRPTPQHIDIHVFGTLIFRVQGCEPV